MEDKSFPVYKWKHAVNPCIHIPEIEVGLIRLPAIGIGTFKLTESAAHILIDKLPVDKLLVDTASKYENEHIIGEALRKSCRRRSQLTIVGKLSRHDLNHVSVEEAAHQSLNRLCIEYFDAYLIHSPRIDNLKETWKALLELQQQGLTTYVGVSNFEVSDLERLYVQTGMWPQINQISLNPFSNPVCWDTVQYCLENHILLQAASPFGGKNDQEWNCCAKESQSAWLRKLFEMNIASIPRSNSLAHMTENMRSISS